MEKMSVQGILLNSPTRPSSFVHFEIHQLRFLFYSFVMLFHHLFLHCRILVHSSATPASNRQSLKNGFSITLQTLLVPRFDREEAHGHESRQEQAPARVDGRFRVRLPGVDGDDWRAKTGDAVEAGSDAGPGASVRGGENFGRAVWLVATSC